MAHSKHFHGPLYSKMSDDLNLTGKAKRTHHGYLREIRKLADHFQTPPDQITEQQLRRYFVSYAAGVPHQSPGCAANPGIQKALARPHPTNRLWRFVGWGPFFQSVAW